MKKYLLLISSILLFACMSQSYSQTCCPSGLYTQETVTTTHPVSGCTFTVTYCYYDGPGGEIDKKKDSPVTIFTDKI